MIFLWYPFCDLQYLFKYNHCKELYEYYALIRRILLVYTLFILVSLLTDSLISSIYYNSYVNSSLSIDHYRVSRNWVDLSLSLKYELINNIYTFLLVRVGVLIYFDFAVALIHWLLEALRMVSLIVILTLIY